MDNWENYLYNGWNMIQTLRVHSDGPRGRGGLLCLAAGHRIFALCAPRQAARGQHRRPAHVIDGANTTGHSPASGSDPTDDYYFPLHDRLGNITGYRKAVANTPAAQLDAVFENDAFGCELRASGSATDKLPFRFSSKFTDAESGLCYYGFRFYQPYLGRWPSRDPIGERGGLNLYAMVLNRAVNMVDKLGLVESSKGEHRHV